jgi:hypothetical protein
MKLPFFITLFLLAILVSPAGTYIVPKLVNESGLLKVKHFIKTWMIVTYLHMIAIAMFSRL